MATLKNNERKCLTSFLLGRKCVFCGHRKFYHTRRGYKKCRYCKREMGRTSQFLRKARKRKVHINGIEGFWSFAKHGLYNYRGGSQSMFPLYLKEMEYRFNHRNDNLLQLLIHLYFGGKLA